jgi:hypothetical protein
MRRHPVWDGDSFHCGLGWRASIVWSLPAFALAFLVRALAAAFEALSALSLRCLAVIALARAFPPRRPISDKNFLTASSIATTE